MAKIDMPDCYPKEIRSKAMSAVKSKNNRSTEKRLIEFFKKFGIKGWRRGYKLYGKPDFVFLTQRMAVFADGCFWHGHNCRNLTPKENSEYWSAKIAKNRARDEEVTATLTSKNWTVIRLWECEIKKEEILIERFGELLGDEKI